jgi:fructokinase
MIRIGIDLGGTKTEAVAMDAAGEIVARKRRPTPRDYDATLATITDLAEHVAPAGAASIRVGVGHPGSSNPYTGLIRNANSTWLNGRPLADDIAGLLKYPVRLSNDADCFALSEAHDGAGEGASIVFGVILGTGVGGGIVIKGELLAGAQGIAGEWGHNPLPWPVSGESPGPKCWCQQHGCIETWLSGPGLGRDHHDRTGKHLDAADIFAAAQAGDRDASTSVDLYLDRLARSLAAVVNLIDPDVIVLGGGVSNAPDLAQQVQSRLVEHVFCDRVTTRIVQNQHGDSSGVRGAAWLWPADEE